MKGSKLLILGLVIFCLQSLYFACKNDAQSFVTQPFVTQPFDTEPSDEETNELIQEEESLESRTICLVYSDADELVQSIKFLHSDNEYTPFLITENEIHVYFPETVNLSNITLGLPEEFNILNQLDFIGTINLSDFVKPIKLIIYNIENNSTYNSYTIIPYDLPVLQINTPDGQEITSKEVRVEGCELKLITEIIEDLGTAGIKGRGNTSWQMEKKPYNVKLDSKKSILGMKKSKKWNLLANAYYDRTQLHNATAFEIARLTDYPWVQSGKFVELLFNGEHKGLYYLCEKIDIAKDRINIEELETADIDEETISGGYLFEADIEESEYSFRTDFFNVSGTQDWNLYWNLKNPDEDVPLVQLEYIKNHMNVMESKVAEIMQNGYSNETSSYRNYLDIETAINWYLVEELCINEEASRTKNCYLYKKRGDDKVYFGPPWDFDAWTFGMAGYNYMYVLESGYFWDTLFRDEFFKNRVKEKWGLYKPIWEEKIPLFIDAQYKSINRSAKRNEVIWPDWAPFYSDKPYEEIVFYMKNSFLRQMEYLDEMINSL